MTVFSPLTGTVSALESSVWCFGDFVLDLPRYELRRNGVAVPVEPQVFDVLTQLVRHHHRVVTKNELFDSVWGGRFVGEAALSSRIKAVRRALGDDGQSQHYIRTARGRGYQFVGVFVDPSGDGPDAGAEDLRSAALRKPEGVTSGRCVLRTRRVGRARYRVARSTRRREFSGPPK